MVILSLNIVGTNVYNTIPMSFPFQSKKESIQFIRDEAFNILCWSHENYGILSNCKIAIKIIEIGNIEDEWWNWEFILNCKNIREFKPFLKLDREEFKSLYIQRNRENSINEILQ